MSFFADRKRDHESKLEAACRQKNYALALLHAAKAAEMGFILAERSEGEVARKYVEDAFELIAICEELKSRAARSVSVVSGREEVNEDGEESRWRTSYKPDLKLRDVAGLEDVKRELREKVILPFQHPDKYEKFKVEVGGGILMYGPPGNGKTFLARATAGELEAAFFNVNASQVKDKYYGQTEKNLQDLFDEAGKCDKAVVFLDEVDHLLGKRGNQKVGSVAQFLTATDGLFERDGCLLLLAATNKPWLLAGPVLRPGRLGVHIYVGPPDLSARASILEFNMRGVPVEASVSYSEIAQSLEDYSGADVAEVCDRAKRLALGRELSTGVDQQVTRADFVSSLEKVRPSVSAEDIAKAESWRDSKSVA